MGAEAMSIVVLVNVIVDNPDPHVWSGFYEGRLAGRFPRRGDLVRYVTLDLVSSTKLIGEFKYRKWSISGTRTNYKAL